MPHNFYKSTYVTERSQNTNSSKHKLTDRPNNNSELRSYKPTTVHITETSIDLGRSKSTLNRLRREDEEVL